MHHHHHRSLRSAGSHGLDRDDACASRLRAEIEEGTIWDVAATKTHRGGNAEDGNAAAGLETYAEWIRVRDRRIAANSHRKKKFIPLSEDIDTLLATKDDVSTTIMMMHKRELMYPISCGLERYCFDRSLRFCSSRTPLLFTRTPLAHWVVDSARSSSVTFSRERGREIEIDG